LSGISYLKKFDMRQFWRLFVDGRFQKKYNGWLGYESGERGSVPALINGFSYMIDNFDLSLGLKATYLRELHKICMLSVETTNLKSSPGDIRYLNSGMPFFAKTTTYEHLQEVFDLRKGDGTAIFNSQKWGKPADELNIDDVFKALQEDGKINYRNWYPNLDKKQQDALDGKLTLHEFYEAKHAVQMMIVSKMEEIVDTYNNEIEVAQNDEEKLRAICMVSRQMELLHPFPDGNCRTFSCVTLTHLLTFNGFPPALLDNPNLDNEVSFEQWVDEVKEGMQRTIELLEDSSKSFFNYSIDEMEEADQKTFLEMTKELKEKIDDYNEIFLTSDKLALYTDGKWITKVGKNMTFSGVGTYGTYSQGNVYFTMSLKDIEAEGKNPVLHLEKILSKGMKAVVIDDMKYFPYVKHLPVLLVEDCFQAFKKCAINVRQDKNPFTLLVTGTEGKTGAKVQFHHLLNQQVKAHGVLNSANTEVPVLRSLINLEVDDEIEINEVSVGSDEAYRVERTMMVNPDLCYFTNIGPNHMDMHKTIENIMEAKSSVVEGLKEDGFCIVNSNIEHYPMLLNAIYTRRPNAKILSYGITSEDNAQLLEQVFDDNKLGWSVKARIEDKILEYYVPMIQKHAPLSSVGILYTIYKMGYDIEKAAKDYESIEAYQTMGILRKLKKKSGDVIFYDQSRRGGLHGMKSAFNDLANIKTKGKTVALVGGISVKKDSDWTKESHKILAELINDSQIDKLYTTGKYMNYVIGNLSDKSIFIKHEDDIDELANLLYDDIEGGDTLFIIGSAYLYLGRVSDRILNFKDNGKAKVNKKEIDKSSITFESLNVMNDVEKGIDLKESLNSYGLTKKEFKDFEGKFKSFINLRTTLLENFFKDLNSLITKENPLIRNVDEEVKLSEKENYVYNEKFCKQWFNNLDKKDNLPKKQLFGTFFKFNSNEFLLHIEVATNNLHIGFVKYKLENGVISLVKMEKEELPAALESINKIFINNFNFEKREWGLRWITIDCGSYIDVTQVDVFNTFLDIENSNLYKNILQPMLKMM